MKKFKSTLPLGTGLKFFDKYLESEMSAEIFDAMYAIFDDFKDSTEGFIIKGGTVTGVAPNGIIEESIVVLNGKILRLQETTGLSYPFFIQEAPLQEINGEFNDLIDRPVVDNEFAETAVSAPVSGQYVEVTAAGNYQKGGFAKRIIEDNGTILKTKIVEIGDWDMDTNNSVSVAHGLDLSKINSKATVSTGRQSSGNRQFHIMQFIVENSGKCDRAAISDGLFVKEFGKGPYDEAKEQEYVDRMLIYKKAVKVALGTNKASINKNEELNYTISEDDNGVLSASKRK